MSPSAARGVRSRLQRRLFEPPIRYGSGRADPYGIGIHAGVVIVGDVGFRGHTVFTALGDRSTSPAIRGHDDAMAVRTAVDPTVLASLVDPVAESDEPLPTAVAAE